MQSLLSVLGVGCSDITVSVVFSTSPVVVMGSLSAGIIENLALRGKRMWLGRKNVFLVPLMLKVMGPVHTIFILG